MAKFTSPVLNYSLGQIIVARVTAHNEKGYSDSTSLSSDGIAVAKTVPVQMSSASITRGSLTSETQIQVNWSPLTSSTDTGGSAILSYNLQFDSGTGLWVDLVGYSSDYSQLTYTVTDGLTKGIAYQFRIRARNIYGWALLLSDPSTIIKTSGVPAQMFKVTTSYDTGVDPTSVKITWLQPYSNSEPVIDYQVVIRHKDFSTFSEESVNCNGAVDPAKTSLYCFVPLTVLRSNPYFLEFNDLVVAKARARNAWGYGIYSESNTAGASIQTEPSAPASPTLDIVLSTLTQIKVDWSPLTGLNTGESPITSYNLQWDAASNGVTWSDLSGQDGALSTELTFTKAGLTPGSYYGFKLRARNVHGWSTSFSAIVQYQSAQWPDKPLPVTTILVNTSIRISWQQPADNFKTITKYRVQIQTQSGSFVENTLFCDGSDLTVMSLRRCDVPVLDILRSTPYSLIQGSLVVANVQAYNSRGWSAISDPNTSGQAIQTEPLQMLAPTRGSTTTTQQILVQWTALTTPQNGDSNVLSYNLEWDAGSSGTNWYSLVGNVANSLSLNFLATNSLTPGHAYRFRVRAKNIWGWGPFSPVTTIYAATVPAKMGIPVFTIDSLAGDLKIDWTQPDIQGDAIISYDIEIANSAQTTWTEYAPSCSGSDPSITFCLVPMVVLEAVPYLYTQGQTIIVRARAVNSYGPGIYSDVNTTGIKLRTIPHAMMAPTRDPSSDGQELVINWLTLSAPNDGDSQILSYNLVWDAGTGTSDQNVIGFNNMFTGTQISVTDSLIVGNAYKFKVRAKNIYGFGPFSPEATIYAYDFPSQPAIMTTQVLGTLVRFSFTPPAANGSSITAYQILIKRSDSTFAEDPSCIASSEPVFSQHYCDLPMADFLVPPYNLAQGTLILAIVKATNVVGDSQFSQVNNSGADVKTVPWQAKPLSIEFATSTNTVNDLKWSQLTTYSETGGTLILNYKLRWNQGAAINTWVDLVTVPGSSTSYLHTTLLAGLYYEYTISAENIFGFGPASSIFTVRTSQVPDQPDPVVTSVYLTYIKVTWTAPFANYQQIASYEVHIKDNGTGIFAENKALCDGADSEVISTMQCLILIKELRLGMSAYDYTLQDLPQFIVRARNIRGIGSFSNPNTSGGLIQTEPISTPVLSRDPLTTETEIIIDWTSLASPQDGYAPVIAYNLQWDKGTNGVSWYDLYGVVPTATLLSFTLTSDIVPGGEYEFRIRAGNVHGFGAFTAPFTIMAAGKPFQVSPPITSIDSATGKLKIEWTAPHDGSDLITSYLIEIADSTTTTWTPDATDCSGTNPAILSCLIPMSTLTSAPYNYLFDDLVKVRVTAINSYGSSPVSSPNSTGARIRRVPDKMGALTVVSKTENQVTLSWSALTGSQIGNSPLIQYSILFDDATGVTDIELDDTLALTYVVNALVGGSTYKFKITAVNIYGPGPFSDEISVLTSDVPDQVAIPTVSIVGTDVQISWDEPINNFEPITAYEIVLLTSTGNQVNDLTNCDGSQAAKVTSRACLIPMSQVINLTGLTQGSLIQARIRAYNANGWVAFGQENISGALIEVQPHKPSTPAYVLLTQNNQQVTITWTALTGSATGGSPITNFYLTQKNLSNSNVVTQTLLSTEFSYTFTSLIGGVSYEYKLIAANKYGQGPSSDPLVVLQSQVPDQPAAPTVTTSGLYVKISWTEPFTNYMPTTSYTILIKDSTGAFAEHPMICDGSSSFSMANNYCYIQMSQLRSTPISLSQGQLIQAKVIATNFNGSSAQSLANASGTLVQTEPSQVALPTQGSATSHLQVQINWTPPFDGGSAITSYAIYWDQGDGSSNFVEVAGETSSFTQTTITVTVGVQVGKTYRLKVKAQNKWGWGLFSNVVAVLAASTPSQMEAPVTSIDAATGKLKISWTQPDTRGSSITAYKIEVRNSLGSWIENTSQCNGAINPVLSNRYCMINMLDLYPADYFLAFQDLVVARVFATN